MEFNSADTASASFVLRAALFGLDFKIQYEKEGGPYPVLPVPETRQRLNGARLECM